MVLKPLTDEEIAELKARPNLSASDVDRLLDFAERAKKLLREEEWSQRREGDDETECCPTCWETKPEGHESGCARAALIGKS